MKQLKIVLVNKKFVRIKVHTHARLNANPYLIVTPYSSAVGYISEGSVGTAAKYKKIEQQLFWIYQGLKGETNLREREYISKLQ